MTVIIPPITARRPSMVQTIVAYRNIREKVSCIEAQRVMFVFNQLHQRLLLLAGFNTLTVEEFKRFPESCHDLYRLVLSEDVNEEELANVTRLALRDVSMNPKLCQLLRRNTEMRVSKIVDLIDQLRTGMIARFTTTQTDADEQILQTRKANVRRCELEKQMKKASEELELARKEQDEEAEKRGLQIQELKNEVENVAQLTEEHTKMVRETTEAEKRRIHSKSDHTQKKLLDEIGPLTAERQKLINQHRQIELELRSRKFRLETEVDGLLNKYDDFMITQQEEIERIGDAYDKEKEELDDLKERFEKLSGEYHEIVEQRRLLAEKEELDRKEFETKTYNATVIQAFFRSYKVRKMLKNKNKKAKKGKKNKS